jgi:hypothetical protein
MQLPVNLGKMFWEDDDMRKQRLEPLMLSRSSYGNIVLASYLLSSPFSHHPHSVHLNHHHCLILAPLHVLSTDTSLYHRIGPPSIDTCIATHQIAVDPSQITTWQIFALSFPSS